MKIGIRSDAGEAGGCETLQTAELARQVRLVGIAVLDGEQRPAGSPMSSPGGQRVGPRQGPAVPTVSSLTPDSRAERPRLCLFRSGRRKGRPISAAPRWTDCAARRQSELYRLKDFRGSPSCT